MTECRKKVSPASAFLPVVSCFSAASAFRHQGSIRYRWSRTSPALPSKGKSKIISGLGFPEGCCILFLKILKDVRNTETNRNFKFWFHETNRNKTETDLVSVSFGSNRNLFLFVSRTPYLCLLIKQERRCALCALCSLLVLI
jgi:hypothetical protein